MSTGNEGEGLLGGSERVGLETSKLAAGASMATGPSMGPAATTLGGESGVGQMPQPLVPDPDAISEIVDLATDNVPNMGFQSTNLGA